MDRINRVLLARKQIKMRNATRDQLMHNSAHSRQLVGSPSMPLFNSRRSDGSPTKLPAVINGTMMNQKIFKKPFNLQVASSSPDENGIFSMADE